MDDCEKVCDTRSVCENKLYILQIFKIFQGKGFYVWARAAVIENDGYSNVDQLLKPRMIAAMINSLKKRIDRRRILSLRFDEPYGLERFGVVMGTHSLSVKMKNDNLKEIVSSLCKIYREGKKLDHALFT